MVESSCFRNWMHGDLGLEVADPVLNVSSIDNLRSHRLSLQFPAFVKEARPDKVVILADLDPSAVVPCITGRKQLIFADGVDLVLIARTSVESWFLGDTEAMRSYMGNNEFFEAMPEVYANAWERLKSVLVEHTGRGPGASKPKFAEKFIQRHGFDLTRAAAHPACPSAAYAIARLKSLAAT
ncbi:MAG: hypothetical protein JNK74_20620 [Candidatus Hydrogenedentes bacterium]|nr:hypothetical protein [Candidatus Hydrogenedentota bacterium]